MTLHEIVFIHGRRVWDSRGRPTVEAEVMLAGGAVGRAIAPAGASTGSGEALDLRDGGETFGGRDVARALANINGEIAAALIGHGRRRSGGARPRLIELDGTAAKTRLGGERDHRGLDGRRPRRRRRGRECRCTAIWAARTPACCRCRRSRSSAAARMPGGGWTSRISWWSARGAAASPRRSTSPPRSIAPPAT